MRTSGEVRPSAATGKQPLRAGIAVVVVSVLVLITQVGALTAEAAGAMMFFANITYPTKLVRHNDGPSVKDQFGKSVAISGETIVVGVPGDDNAALDHGSAYIFDRNGGSWTQSARLAASDPGASDQFGVAVDIHGDTVVVGSFADGNGDTGSAYLYQRTSGVWTQIRKLTVGGLPPMAFLGFSVAISQNYVALGAKGNATVYVFKRDAGGSGGWSNLPVATLPGGGGGFSENVSMSGDLLAVSARVATLTLGKVFIYDAGINFALVKTVTGPRSEAWARDIGISGDTLVAGAPAAFTGALSAHGAAYIYQQNVGGAGVWGLVKKVVASEVPNAGTGFDQLGNSVAISGDMVVAGAFADDIYNDASGSAYVFQRNQGGTDNWGETNKLIPDAGGRIHFFGFSVATTPSIAVVGSPIHAASPDPGPGSADIFEIGSAAPPPPPAPTSAPSVASGLTAWPSASGVMDVNWTDNSTDEAGFKLQRRVAGSSSWTTIDWPAAGVMSFSDGGLNPAIAYCYRIRSYNAAGSSGYVDSLPQCTPASPATIAPAATSAFTATAASSTRIDLQWTDNSLVERGHKLQRRASGSASWTTIAWPGVDVTSYADTGLTPGAYCYRMRAYNLIGSSSYVRSSPVCISTGGVPATPTFVMATSASASQVNVNWNDNANNELGFKVQRRPIGSSSWTTIKWAAADSTGYSDAGLAAGAYCYRIRAFNSSGSSPYGETFPRCVSAGGVPAAPTGVSAAGISSSQIDVSWTDNSSNELGFKVERQPQGGSGWTTVKWAAPGATSFSNTGLASGTYCYRIRAFNSNGSSIYVSAGCAATS